MARPGSNVTVPVILDAEHHKMVLAVSDATGKSVDACIAVAVAEWLFSSGVAQLEAVAHERRVRRSLAQ